MGFWSHLGKTLLEVAPYVAAPFTGGVSLLAAPLASKAVDAWNTKDAANDAAQGIAPSSYDKYLGMGGDVASIGAGVYGGVAGLSGLSNLGNAGKVLSMTAPIAGAAAGQALGNKIAGSGSTQTQSTQNTSSGSGISPSSAVLSAISSMRSPSSGTQVGQASSLPGSMSSSPSMSSGGIGPTSQMGYLGYNQSMTNPNLQTSLNAGNQAGQDALRRRGIY
jgi:hypothetical protein